MKPKPSIHNLTRFDWWVMKDEMLCDQYFAARDAGELTKARKIREQMEALWEGYLRSIPKNKS